MFDWNLNLNLELEGRTRPTPATYKGAFRGAESGIQRHVCLFVYHVNTDLKLTRTTCNTAYPNHGRSKLACCVTLPRNNLINSLVASATPGRRCGASWYYVHPL